MMRTTILLLFLSMVISSHSHENRDLLQKEADVTELKKALLLNQGWVTYPNYADRAGWDKLNGKYKKDIIQKGESALAYEWKVIKATDYMDFERSGSRDIMQKLGIMHELERQGIKSGDKIKITGSTD